MLSGIPHINPPEADKTLDYATKASSAAVISKSVSDYTNPKSFLRILLPYLPKSKISVKFQLQFLVKINSQSLLLACFTQWVLQTDASKLV